MVAAEKVTPEVINFMATHGRGLICLAMTGQRLDDLNIPLMVSDTIRPVWHGVLRLDRSEASVSTGISVRSRANHPYSYRSENDAERPGTARAHLPASRP